MPDSEGYFPPINIYIGQWGINRVAKSERKAPEEANIGEAGRVRRRRLAHGSMVGAEARIWRLRLHRSIVSGEARDGFAAIKLAERLAGESKLRDVSVDYKRNISAINHLTNPFSSSTIDKWICLWRSRVLSIRLPARQKLSLHGFPQQVYGLESDFRRGSSGSLRLTGRRFGYWGPRSCR